MGTLRTVFKPVVYEIKRQLHAFRVFSLLTSRIAARVTEANGKPGATLTTARTDKNGWTT